MLHICGFNGFNQCNALRSYFSNNTNHKSKGSKSSSYENQFHTIRPVIEESGGQIPNSFKILLSWSYFFMYNENTLWFYGFLDGKDNSIKKVDSPKNLVILQASCNRRQVVCVTEDGGCWQYTLQTGLWKELSEILNAELHGEEAGRGTALKVSCGDTLTAILTAAGHVYNMPNRLALPGVKIVDVACGRSHILMLSERGQVFTVGEGSRGQLGHGELENEEEPCLVEGLAGLNVVTVACGGWHSCAVTADGDLYTWGWNMIGQLGLCTKETNDKVSVQAVPLVVDWPGDMEVRVIKVACGARHTVALLADGSVWGCGWNSYGQLALSGVENVNSMTRLPTPDENIRDILCGPWNTFLVT